MHTGAYSSKTVDKSKAWAKHGKVARRVTIAAMLNREAAKRAARRRSSEMIAADRIRELWR